MQYIEVDHIVVGSGVAGMSCALEAAKSGSVALLTKEKLLGGNTPLAQGGIAAALGANDSHNLHIQDTLRAGAGKCDPAAVEILVKEGTERVRELLRMGFPCDMTETGLPLLGREGAHSIPRVISARGDGSGKALAETLAGEIEGHRNITLYERTFVFDLLVWERMCQGLIAYNLDTGVPLVIVGRSVVLATGGCGQIFLCTTNNIHCTGDGLALAYRAGAVLENMEFVQFHPTTLNVSENPMFLISEAVRGKGAVLVNSKGERFMKQYHPLAELAPRDVVARGIAWEINAGEQVFLDVSSLGEEFPRRFPSIFSGCIEHGIFPPHDPIPVVPAAHFLMGGVKSDLDGRTTLAGLYVCGEVASTGVHGANRLASNSLLEGLVFGYRVGRAVAKEKSLPKGFSPGEIDKALSSQILSHYLNAKKGAHFWDPSLFKELRQLMWFNVGIIRTGEGLAHAVKRLNEMANSIPAQKDYILRNMVTVACLIAKSAVARKESRGSHYRADFPGARGNQGNLRDVCTL